MSVEGHIQALERRHRELDVMIDELEQLPNPDSLKVTALKRRKLEIKDELEKMRGASH